MIYFNLKIFVSTISVIRQKMYDIKILLIIGLIFELGIVLAFQYTQLHLGSGFNKYICILNTIFTTHLQKRFTFKKMPIICR